MERSILDPEDRIILRRRAGLFWARHAAPAVGDWVEFADGISRRISHVWDVEPVASIQTSDGGSFYLGEGSCSFSGALYPPIPTDTLTLTGDTREGSLWFFHHNVAMAHNGVYTTMPFAVYRCTLQAHPASRF